MSKVARLDAVLKHITENPDLWDQRYWYDWKGDPESEDRTLTMCFAGHAAIMFGFCDPPPYNYMDWADQNGTDIVTFAKDALGVYGVDAHVLFHADNTLDEIREYIDYLRERK